MTALVGGAAGTLSVGGGNFTSASRIVIAGTERATTFASASQLSTPLAAADLVGPAVLYVAVVTPPPGGGRSDSLGLQVGYGAPTLTAVTPASVFTSAGGVTVLTLTGTFAPTTQRQVGGLLLSPLTRTATTITISVPAGVLELVGTRAVAAVTPGPNGGTSTAVNVSVTNPVPVALAVLPDSLPIGASDYDVLVVGTGFRSNSVARVNGADRFTVFIDCAHLSMTVLAADRAAAGNNLVSVSTPAPGGGISGAATIRVQGNAPQLVVLQPRIIPTGGAFANVDAVSTGFSVPVAVQVNGVTRSGPAAPGARQSVTLGAAEIATPATFSVRFIDPVSLIATGTGLVQVVAVNAPVSRMDVPMRATDFAYDTSRSRVHVTVSSLDPTRPNTLATVNPVSGVVERAVSLLADPAKVGVSNDGRYAYICYTDLPGMSRVNLATGVRDLEIGLGNATNTCSDILPVPGSTTAMAVALFDRPVSQGAGVAIFDDTVRRALSTTTTGSARNVNTLVAVSATTLLGLDQSSTARIGFILAVSPLGATIARSVFGVSGGGGHAYASGRLFPGGQLVYDATSLFPVMRLPNDGGPLAQAHELRDKLYLGYNNGYNQVLSLGTLAPIGLLSYELPANYMSLWGSDGMMLRTGSVVSFIRSPLIGP